MSIIYDALQKTQQHREIKQPLPGKKKSIFSPVRLTLALCLTLCAVAIVIMAFYTKGIKRPVTPPPSTVMPMKNIPPMTLNGIFFSSQYKIAMINNHIFQIGDMVNGMKIVDIQYDNVQLEHGNHRLELR